MHLGDLMVTKHFNMSPSTTRELALGKHFPIPGIEGDRYSYHLNFFEGEDEQEKEEEQSQISKAASDIAVIADALSLVKGFIAKLGVSNDNGVIAARDKIWNFIRQAHSNGSAIITKLATGKKLGHADINNVGTTKYYTEVMARLFQFASEYILQYAGQTSTVLGRVVDPQETLARFTMEMQNGKNMDHAFWIAFTARKDPFDLRSATTPIGPTSAVVNKNLSSDVVTEDERLEAKTKQVVTYVTLGLAVTLLIIAAIIKLKNSRSPV